MAAEHRKNVIPGAPSPASNAFLKGYQYQKAACFQSFGNFPPGHQAYSSTENPTRAEEPQTSMNGDKRNLETEGLWEDTPPQLDNWGLPNTDFKYFNEGMPDNPQMLDLDYVEENPQCVLLFSPEEALTFGTWTDWKLNNRIRRWMVEQDLNGIANSAEEVWTSTCAKNFVASSVPEHDYLFLEDIVQVWDSVSLSKTMAVFDQKLHENSKMEIVTQVMECLEVEDDWIPGEPSPDMARVIEEEW